MKRLQSIINGVAVLAFMSCAALQALPGTVHAASVTNPAPTAKISFTFDDGLASAYTNAAPILTKYGLKGTGYVITGCVGMITIPNTCHANTDAKYMSWTQVTGLQNTYGWEIGSHTATHPYLATSDATDGQPNVLTPAQVATELTTSKSTLATHGITATDFSTPYGDYNNAVLAQIAKVYATHRGFADEGTNVWPYNDYLLNDLRVQEGVTVAQVEAKIDAAIANKNWLILTMHDIQAKPSTNPDDYQYGTTELDQIAAYVKAKQTAGLINPVKVNQGNITSDTNMLPNGSFNNGIADGWTTDDATHITKDTASNGSYPDATNSIKLVSGTANGHLFSPKVSVNSNTTYMFKNFLNVQSITSGEVAFYVDEYDVNGNWVSGQYLKAERSSFVENLNFTYKPSSVNVVKASLQVISAGTGITAYLDNTQMFALSTATTTQTNLLTNGAFDSGITSSWTTDDAANIVANSASNGSPNNPVNSVALKSGTVKNGHLFSPQIAVSPAKVYTLSNYLNLKAITSGEVAFYIDEYDASGNWISGQYKLGVHTVSAGDVSFSYQPSSNSVAKASLQVIVTSNSGISAYFDDARWYAN